MKKFLPIFLLISFFSLLAPSQIWAKNILGINIAARHEEFDDAAEVVGEGGWVVIMASPGNADELKPILTKHPEVNIILRGHCPSDPLGPDDEENRKFALSWAATLGRLDTAGRTIFFMPWNEPNMTRECQGVGDDFNASNTDCAPHVVKYIENLQYYLSDAGLSGSNKVKLLSPMINQHHANYKNFIQALGGRAFFNRFYGVSMNLYDNETCGSPLCHPDVVRNAGKVLENLQSVNLEGMKVFGVETGIIDASGTCPPGVTDCPFFDDSRMNTFIRAAVPKWSLYDKFEMFSPLSYNPETNDPSWIYGGLTAGFYTSPPIRNGTVFTGSAPVSFSTWLGRQGLITCPQSSSTYILPDGHCGFCAAGSYLLACKPIDANTWGEEYSRESPNLPEEATYQHEDKNGACLSADFSGTIALSGLKIPFAKEVNKYFLGSLVDNPKQKLTQTPEQALNSSGVIERLAPAGIQDNLKLAFLGEIQVGGYNGRYKDFRIDGWEPGKIITTFKDIEEKKKLKPMPTLTSQEREFNEKGIWTQVPLFANEESLGHVTFYGSGIEAAENTVNTSVPEVYRLYKASDFLMMALTSGLALTPMPTPTVLGQQTQAGQVLATCLQKTQPIAEQKNTKEGKTGLGDLICAKAEIQGTDRQFFGSREWENDAEKVEHCETHFPAPTITTGRYLFGIAPDVRQCCGDKGVYLSQDLGFGYTRYVCTQCLANETCYHDGIESGLECRLCHYHYPEVTKAFTDTNINSINKVPYLDKIAQYTIGPQGFFNVIVPYLLKTGQASLSEVQEAFKEVAGESTANLAIKIDQITKGPNVPEEYIQFKVDGAENIKGSAVSPGTFTKPLTLLFHQLGTLINVKDFISKKDVLPFSLGTSSILPGQPNQPGNLSYTIPFKDPGVTVSSSNKSCVISQVTRNWPGSKIASNWDTVYNTSLTNNWNPAFVIALWIEESGASGVSAWDLGCGVSNREQNNLSDQLACLFDNFNGETNFEKFMCTYSEGHYPCDSFILNPNFPTNLKIWYDRLTGNCP